MAFVEFPARPTNWGLTETREERNLYARADEVTLLDVVYSVHELEMLVGQMSGSFAQPDQSDVASQVAELGSTLGTLQAQIEGLVSALDALPVHYELSGPPPSGLGKNGDTCWDNVGTIGYKKMGNTWRQQA